MSTFTWHRRTRFGDTDFQSPTVPLNEDREVYSIQIGQPIPGSILYTTTVFSPRFVFSRSLRQANGGFLNKYSVQLTQDSSGGLEEDVFYKKYNSINNKPVCC